MGNRHKKKKILWTNISPHQEFSGSTVSNWIKTTLKLSGVSELGQFGGNSKGSASTFKTILEELSVNGILCRSSWSNKST